MRYSQKEMEQREKTREDIAKARAVFKELIYPSREYVNYFLEYFPDWDTTAGRHKLRSCWNGQTADEEFLRMLKILIEKQKQK